MQQIKENCCNKKKSNSFLPGLFYGLIPHSFCIAYLIFSILGITAGVAFFRKFFYIPYLFQSLIALSFIFATISAAIYLKKNKMLSTAGIKKKWKYLAILYITVVSVNLLFFFVIFPATANLHHLSKTEANAYQLSFPVLSLKTEIPCSGHAPLIIDELKKINGVKDITFKTPNLFYIKYDPNYTSPLEIKSLDIFKEYKATSL